MIEAPFSLPPFCAHLCLEVEKKSRHLGIRPNQKLALAVSGGADSIALALVFYLLAPRLMAKLHVLHINHCLRPDAWRDAEHVRQFCHTFALPCEIVKINVGEIAKIQGCGLEEAGRIARYRTFDQFCDSINADYLILAHHLGDLCEDVLMRLIRGVGWPALGGMHAVQGRYLRPLLLIAPQKLRKFLIALNIPWQEDESNFSLEFLRNRIRHGVLPAMLKENPSLPKSISQLHTLAGMDEDFWENHLANALALVPWREQVQNFSHSLTLPCPLLDSLHPAARLRLYHKAINYLKNKISHGQARADILLKLDQSWLKRSSGKIFQFPGKIHACISKGDVIFAED